VARAERAAGRPVAITGAADERPVALRIAEAAGVEPERVLAGSTDVRGLAAAVAAAGRVICGDTGVAHLATAFGTPSVVLFGPVPPAEWGPPPDRERHRALWAGRRGDPHGAVCDPGLLEIGPDAAVRALAALV
jgi:ADP-heptose:LPS heptosyltransferase